MLKLGSELETRDLDKQPLSEKELSELIGARDYVPFLNSRNKLYRERNMAQNIPARDAAIRLMCQNPNLIKRPIAQCGQEMVLGFDVAAYTRLVK